MIKYINIYIVSVRIYKFKKGIVTIKYDNITIFVFVFIPCITVKFMILVFLFQIN